MEGCLSLAVLFSIRYKERAAIETRFSKTVGGEIPRDKIALTLFPNRHERSKTMYRGAKSAAKRLVTKGHLLLFAVFACNAQEPATIHVDVNEVTVAVTVSHQNGAPVGNLRREDFTILDNGQLREIQSFWQETDLPLSIGLIVDVSGSQRGVIGKHFETIAQFLSQVMGPRDRAFLLTVGDTKVRLATDLTSSLDELRTGVDAIRRSKSAGALFGEFCRPGHSIVGLGSCDTVLWDGVYSAARLKMKPVTGRKALIVLSDGGDLGSLHTLTDAIEAAQSADTLVYTIQYVAPLYRFNPIFKRTRARLQRLSDGTGAKAFDAPKDPGLVFAEIETDLRNLYVLGFTPSEDARDGKFHTLEIKIRKADATVRARQGYKAPLSKPISSGRK